MGIARKAPGHTHIRRPLCCDPYIEVVSTAEWIICETSDNTEFRNFLEKYVAL